MSDQPRTISETCRCGGSTSITADSVDQAQAVIREWRDVHPCTSRDEAASKGRTGGAAQAGFAAPIRQPWGHLELDVRAGAGIAPISPPGAPPDPIRY